MWSCDERTRELCPASETESLVDPVVVLFNVLPLADGDLGDASLDLLMLGLPGSSFVFSLGPLLSALLDGSSVTFWS